MDNWVTLRGRPASVSIANYLIDWEGKSLSIFQRNVKLFLMPYWSKTKVVCEEFPVPGTRMTIDIVNVTDRIAIECQGTQHTQYNKFMHDHSTANFRAQFKRDLEKAEWCVKNGLTLIEVFPKDVAELSSEWFKTKYNIDL